MSKQVISLEIKDRSLTKLAGNSYGRKLFDAQVDGRIDLNELFSLSKSTIWRLRLSRGSLGKFILKSDVREWKKILTSLSPRFPTPKKPFWIV